MKNTLLTILFTILFCIVADAQFYYRSYVSGTWSSNSTWERSSNMSTWSSASSGQIPGITDTVFIQNGHVVTLAQNESCCDLNMNNANTVSLNTGTTPNRLSVNGRLRLFNSAINTFPVTYTTTNSGTAGTWMNTSGGGAIKVVGNSRVVINTGEWAANPQTWNMEFALNTGQTATINTNFKAGRISILSGNVTITSGDIRPDAGTGTGDLIISAGAKLTVNGGLRRTGTSGAQFDTLAVNGTLELGGGTLAIAEVNCSTLVVGSGASIKMMNYLYAYTTSIINNVWSSGSNMEYAGTAAQTIGGEWPAALAVKNLKINNSAGLTMPTSRIVLDSLIMIAGNITVASTDSLILGTTATAKLTRTGGAIIGKINRFVGLGTTGNIVFPVGTATAYRPLATNFVSAPLSAGNISIFHVDNGTSSTACTGFTDGSYTINRRSNSYWQGYYNSSITGMNITLSADLSGQSGILNASETRIIASIDNGVSFGLVGGSHSAGSGTIAYRTGFVMGAGPLTVRIYFGGNATTNPLPVKIYNFNAKKINDHILVSWHTAFEQNNDHFEIEKSEDGIAFRTIEKYIKGSQNSNTLLKYEFMDVEKTISNVYYRIKQIDNDANYSYSNVIHYVNQSEIEVVFSPNPITDELVIASSKNIETEIEVYDISGKILFKSIYHDNLIQINTASFPTGVLFIKVNQNGMNTVKRVVKK